MSHRILVADDHPLIREHLRVLLETDGFEVATAGDGAAALAQLRAEPFRLAIVDLRLPGMTGLELLATIRAESLPLGVILLSGPADTPLARDAIRQGADDFVRKPYDPAHLRFVVQRILERRRLIDERDQLRKPMRQESRFPSLVSKNPRMRRIFDLIEAVGPLGAPVLIEGETGTGKELVAQAIHAADRARTGRFVALHCAVLTESQLETELLDNDREALNEGETRQTGGGTLFLDEVADLSPTLQARLLKALNAGESQESVSTETLGLRTRIIAASTRRLDQEVRAERFRADLHERLSLFRIDLPTLRERAEDIPLLAQHFLEKHRGMSTPPVTEIDPAAMRALLSHGWPGHVRELENTIRSAIALTEGTTLCRESLPEAVATRHTRPALATPLIDVERTLPDLTRDMVARVERAYFSHLLTRYRGNVARCARHSGLSRRSVTQKLLRHELDRRSFKNAPPPG